MPVQTDTPSGVGALNEWGVYGVAATDKMQAVATNDGDSSVVYGVSGGRVTTQDYTFPKLVGVGDPVTSILLVAIARMYAVGGGARTFVMRSNGVADATNWGAVLFAQRYQGYQVCSYSPAAVTLADANGEQGFYVTAAGGPSNAMEVWVTQFYRNVTFTFTVGGAGEFAHLIGSLMGFAIGGNLLLREMPRLARAISRVWTGGRNVRLLDNELEPAWQAWRSFRHPAYSFGGVDALE